MVGPGHAVDVSDEVVAMPVWLMLTLVIGGFMVLMLVIAFAWSKWMTRPGAPDD